MWAGTVFDTENFALRGSLQILRTTNKILDTVHIKETSCTLNLLTCRYISKFGSWCPCSLVGDGHFGEHAVFTFRKAVTKVTLLRIFTACLLNSSTHHKKQVTQQTRRTFLSLLESQILYHLRLL